MALKLKIGIFLKIEERVLQIFGSSVGCSKPLVGHFISFLDYKINLKLIFF